MDTEEKETHSSMYAARDYVGDGVFVQQVYL